MPIRFLADANLDQDIVSGLLRREPEMDFELPQGVIRDGLPDPKVLSLAASLDRILVTHDVRTMPAHFTNFIETRQSPGLIIIPTSMPIGQAIVQMVLIWKISEPAEWINLFRRLPL